MRMKYVAILLALFILILSVGVISATSDFNDTVKHDENRIDEQISIDQSSNDLKQTNTTNDNTKTANQSSTSQSTTKTGQTKKVTKTVVSTPDASFLYKRNSTFKITIKDKTTKQPIKNLKIAFKIKIGKKYKTYTLKTDKKGVAKFNTKKLSLGYHKFIITSKNSDYKVSKKDSLFIGNLFVNTLKMGKSKTLKNGDAITTFIQKKNGQYLKGVHTDIWYTGGKNPDKASPEAKFSQLYKAKFFFKNKKTGKIITKSTRGKLLEFDGELYRDYPHVDLIKGYTPIKTKIWYITSKK